MYADDIKIFTAVKDRRDCHRLQDMLTALGEWCNRNCLQLCPEKCQIITFSRARNPILCDYVVGINTVLRTRCVRDLGILLDDRLTFCEHIESVITKANQVLGLMMKVCNEFKDPMCLKTVYCAIVRSILEYNCVVWCPLSIVTINRIESIQRKFSRYALRLLRWPNNVQPPYNQRCLLLGLNDLSIRRKNLQCMFLFRLLRSEIDSQELLSNINMYAPSRTGRSMFHFRVDRTRNNYGQRNPLQFMCRELNFVLDSCDFDMSTSVFKERLKYRRS